MATTTSNLERIQCIALAVRAANIKNYKVPVSNTISIRAATTTEKVLLENMVSKSDINSREELLKAFLLSEEEFFFDLFNFYKVKSDMKFLNSKKDKVIFIPKGTPITQHLLEIIPTIKITKEATKSIEKIEKEIEKLLERNDELSEELRMEEQNEDVNAKNVNDLKNKIAENEKKIENLQAEVGSDFDYGDVPKDTQKLQKFVDTKFDFSVMVKPNSKYMIRITKANKTYSIPPALLKVWNVTDKLQHLKSSNINFDEYVFLDQNSDFMATVKDNALKVILEKFKLPVNQEILSPVDLFMVKRTKQRDIIENITKNIIQNDNLLLSYSQDTKQKPTTYKSILQKYFDTNECIGISIKLPEKVGGEPILKLMGEYSGDSRELADSIDPFTKFLLKIDENPSQMDVMINELVDIKFEKFSIRSNLRSWSYPITFKYKNIFPETGLDLNFTLFTWSNAGFNGQWDKNQSSGAKVPANWTGGFGMNVANKLFPHYTAYNNTILPELLKRRHQAFRDTIATVLEEKSRTDIDRILRVPRIQSAYRKALEVVKKPSIIGRATVDDSKPLINFFRLLDEQKVLDVHEKINKIDEQIDSLNEKKKYLAKNSLSERQQYTNDIKQLGTERSTLKKEYDNLLRNKGKDENILQYYTVYRARVIDNLLKDMGRHDKEWENYVRNFEQLLPDKRGGGTSKVSYLPNIEAHYVAVQFAWFLFKGGPRMHLDIKRKIFLSVFGIITKSGYKIFEHYTDIHGNLRVKDILKHKVMNKSGQEVYAQFSHAPYVVLS